MNIPRYSIENSKVIWFILAVMVIGGVVAFLKLPKKEDSPFSIKSAVLVTQYPGASPQEVEELVTEPIEREIQSMGRVREINSESGYGVSKITIDLEPDIPPDQMPVKWDELRRKVANIQPQLPQGASQIVVNDDFGDVYGIYYALVMDDGFSFADLRNVAQQIKKGLTPLEGVQKVQLYGERQEVVNIFVQPSVMANLGVDVNSIIAVMQAQNLLVPTGEIGAGKYQIKVVADGTYGSLQDIRNQIIVSRDGREVRIGDIATVEAGYLDPPSTLMRVNGKWAIGIGVATGKEDDVVAVGDLVGEYLRSFDSQLPVGMDIVTLYPENEIAREANNGFILNLVESLVIVIAIILLVMGVRAGVLIGSSLLFSVGGTLLVMLLFGVGLNRTSLAAFIIAMGMLVDNAIVVTDNAQNGIKRGMDRVQALTAGATLPQWGLLGATFIAVASFLPLYLAPESVAEIVKPLFIVLAISLGLSWLLAMSQTPLFGSFILKSNKGAVVQQPYSGKFYSRFERILGKLIRYRYITLGGVVALLVISLWVMSIMPQSFFPSMDKPYSRADLIFPDGFSIDRVQKEVVEIEKYLAGESRIKNYSITMGSSPLRYYLASASYGPMPNYANVLIETYDSKESPAVEADFYNYMSANYPDIITRSSLFMLSPAPEAKIEIGFVGHNIDTLTRLVASAMDMARGNSMVMDVRNSWGNPIPVVMPLYSQEKGLRLGITREQFAYSLKMATTGVPMGGFRSSDLIMPILLKDASSDSIGINDLRGLPVYSKKSAQVSVGQVSDAFDVKYRYGKIKRHNRERVMLMQCDPHRGTNGIAAFKSLYAQIADSINVPQGYSLAFFGEQRQQERSNSALGKYVPLTFLLIYFVLLLLFPTAFRKPVVIMAMLPLIFIGVVWGLIIFGKSMDFFAILGLLGLIGMNIKNAIVLVEQIGLEQQAGEEPLRAVVQATKSRIVPVTMASGTTILGMVPLLFDAMFAGMAATIMGGLFMATLLTIFVLPVTYCIFFGIAPQSDKTSNPGTPSSIATDFSTATTGRGKAGNSGSWASGAGCTLLILLLLLPALGSAVQPQQRRTDTLLLDVESYKKRVAAYSREIMQSGAGREAMASAVAFAKSALYPSVALQADGQYRINGSSMNFGAESFDMPHDSYSVVARMSQVVYGGGVKASYGMARVNENKAIANEELTYNDVLYAAETAYWRTVAQGGLYEVMCSYVEIIGSLETLLGERYNEGAIAQTDYLQILSRLKEALIGRSNIYKSYVISLQNLNVMMGESPDTPVKLVTSFGGGSDSTLCFAGNQEWVSASFHEVEGVQDSSDAPLPDWQPSLQELLARRPEYKIASLDVDYREKELNLVKSNYNPQIEAGVQQSWGTPALNFTGNPQFNTGIYAKVNIPLFEWGARYKRIRWQRSLISEARLEMQRVADNIVKEVANARVEYQESIRQLEMARQAREIAQTNLELNTFSYTEGRLAIVDVLSSQVTWLQAESRYVELLLGSRVARATYLKALGSFR